MLPLYIHWNADPEIFRVGSFAVRWYGLFFASAFFLGYIIMGWIYRKENLQEKLLDKLALYMIISTVIGARLGHCLFYQPDYYLAKPLEILKIWEGGLASHGAAIAILIALYFYARKTGLTYLWTLDRIVIVVALAGFFIRMGNLMNSEIFGKHTTLPWGFVFMMPGADDSLIEVKNGLLIPGPRHPTQLYEGISYLLLFAGLLWYYFSKGGKTRDGLIFGWFLLVLFGIRFLIEFLKEPQVAFEKTMSLNMGQLLSIPFILTGIYLIYRVRRKPFLPWPSPQKSDNTSKLE